MNFIQQDGNTNKKNDKDNLIKKGNSKSQEPIVVKYCYLCKLHGLFSFFIVYFLCKLTYW